MDTTPDIAKQHEEEPYIYSEADDNNTAIASITGADPDGENPKEKQFETDISLTDGTIKTGTPEQNTSEENSTPTENIQSDLPPISEIPTIDEYHDGVLDEGFPTLYSTSPKYAKQVWGEELFNRLGIIINGYVPEPEEKARY